MRWLRLALWPAGALLGVEAESASFGWDDPRHWIPDLVTGWTLIACGLIAWAQRPDSRSGPLLAATGFAWFAGNFASDALYLYRGPLVQLLVTYPTGRTAARRERVIVAVGYVAAAAAPVWRSETASIVLALLLIAVCAASYASAVGPIRRSRLVALSAASGLGLALAGGAGARLIVSGGDAGEPSLLVLQAALCVMAGTLLWGLLVPSSERPSVTDLVIELGERRGGTVRDELARALADPTLEVGYRVPGRSGFADAEGRPLALPAEGDGRSLTVIEGDRGPVAALVHDPAALDDPGLRAAVAAAARLAAANARLTAEVRAQLTQLAASRRRLLEAGDEERRRLEERLRAGAQARLERLAEQLRAARVAARSAALSEQLDRAEAQLGGTLEDLQRLARGLHPQVLSEAGLARAITALAQQAPMRVEVRQPVPQLPARIEAVAYFVCSEALANAAKHAGASRAVMSITATNGRVSVLVEDDGRGGADPALGTGLGGLADRVQALGGTLDIRSPAGHGTRLTADIPLDGQPILVQGL